MAYSDFGLDDVKKSADDGVEGLLWCPWCMMSVKKGFSLCFSNFCICHNCIEEGLNSKNDKWLSNVYGCFKCSKGEKKKDLTNNELYFFDKSGSICICKKCLNWGKDVLNNQEKYFNNMVLEVLKNCTVEGNVIKLPTGQLDRKVYTEVKNKLELIGGKWKGGKVQGFVFEEDPTELLTDLQNGDERNLKKEYQFFPTPPDIAQQMVSNLPTLTDELKILEPSAGDGALIKALRLHRNWDKNVDCFELMDINRKKLAKIDGSLLFAEPDFLKSVELASYPHLIEQYDIIIANPPFTKNQDIDHILAMYKCLKPGGTIITLASPSWTTGTQKKQVEFKEWLESMDVFPLTLPEKSFAASGTMITPLLLQIKKPKVVANYIPPESKFANKPFGQEFDSEIIEAFKKGDELKNPTNMNFFQTLYEMLDGIDLNIQFKRVNGNLELNVIPEMAAGVKPVKIIGTAEELDAEFFTVIYKPIDKFKGVKVDMEAFEKSADKAKEEKEEEDDDTEKTTTNKKAPISSKKALPKKQLAEKKAVTQSEPSLFD